MRNASRHLFVVLLSLLAITPVFAQPKLPFYFPQGIVQQPDDPVKQLSEYWRYMRATDPCMQIDYDFRYRTIIDKETFRVDTNIKSTASITDPDTTMEIILTDVVSVKDVQGKIEKDAHGNDLYRMTNLCEQKFLTKGEVDTVVEDLKQAVIEARDLDYAQYATVTDDAIEERARALGMPPQEFAKMLDEKDPMFGVPFRDINRIPHPQRPSDFVPRQLIFGFTDFPGVHGISWLNTGVVHYNPQARIRDYLKAKPGVLMHESVHNNVNLQKFPFSRGFDADFFAEIPATLLAEDKIDVFLHPYDADFREAAWVFFRLDFKRAKEEIFLFNAAGNMFIDEDKLREFIKEVDRAKVEFLKVSRVMFKLFYADPVWWMSAHDRLKDDNAIFRFAMAISYDPTILGGHKETMEFLTANEEVIRRAAKESYEDLGGSGSDDNDMDMRVPRAWEQAFRRLPENDQEALRTYFTKHPFELKQLPNMDPEKLLNLVEQILKSGKNIPSGGAQ